MMTAMRWIIAIEWLNSGWGKFTNPKYLGGFAATNASFAAKTSFPWYKDFLTGTVIPNATFWANFTMYGELLVGTALLLGLLTNVGLVGGFLLNLNFWLAASNTSPSTFGVNYVMGGLTLALLLSPGSKWLSVDRWLAEHPLRGLASKHPRLTRAFLGRKVTL